MADMLSFGPPSFKVFLFLLLITGCMFFMTFGAYAQLSRKHIKKNNRRVMTYRGDIKNRFGQERQYLSLGISANTMNYFGDLSPNEARISTDLSLTKPGIGATVAHRFSPVFTFQADLLYSRIYGSDANSADKNDLANGIFRYNRNLSFRNAIKEFSVTLTYDLVLNHLFFADRALLTPYVFAGVAVFHHNPQAQVPENDLQGNVFQNGGKWIDLHDLGTEGQYSALKPTDINYNASHYMLIQPAIPAGVGVRIKLANDFDLSAEFGMRFLFTDYIDDVSKNFVDLGVFGSNTLARALSYRSNEITLPNHQYISEYDGQSYAVVAGYGEESTNNKRGNSTQRDFYTVLKIRLSYVLPARYARAKYR